MIQCDTNIELKHICRSVTYISWSSEFALYLEDYLMDKVITGILDPCDSKIYHIKCMWVSDLHKFSWSSDSVLYLEDFLMDECCTEDIDSM